MSERHHTKEIYLGTAAERAAVSLGTESPSLFWYETDNDLLYMWTGTAWSYMGGPVYGGISVVGNAVETAIAVAGTAVQVTIFDTNMAAANMTPDHTNDHVTVDIAGDYLIVVSATINSVAGADSRFEMTVQKNNGAAAVGALHVDRNIGGGASAAGSVSMSGIATLAANDTVEVWIENESNTQNYVAEDVTLNLVRVS
ncbi:MAG: hypothetical protein AMJ53_18610 [Gammaproteobacteria bacterium SG8_11]|nr:MAG: hypothetical protein AMJ53_18610 [Gammaproteobacteria bacterium SG8_11]